MQNIKKSWIVIAVVVLLAIWAIGSYNGLVRQDKAVNNQWAQVETQYQRRLDLVPNLVATVKGVSQQEKDVVAMITGARAAYGGARTTDQKAAAASQLETGIGRLLVVAEANPQISTLPAFQDLMVQLEGTENRVSVERNRYNDEVTKMNTKVSVFPSNIFAKLFGFHERTLFKAAEGAQNSPPVDFTK